MRTSIIFIALLLSVIPLHAQSTDWNRLESLSEGTRLIVHTGRGIPCTLSFIDDEGIDCALRFSMVHIPRARVAAVSLSRPERTTAISALTGAAAGAGLAAANKNDGYRPQAALGGALVGGAIGSLVGHLIGLTHGPTIYVRP